MGNPAETHRQIKDTLATSRFTANATDRLLDVGPFLDDAHRELGARAAEWAAAFAGEAEPEDVEAVCRAWVKRLGEAGFVRYVVPRAYGGEYDEIDVRSLCVLRETLAFVSGLADFAFALQGLGSGPIVAYGTEAQKHRYLPAVAAGRRIAAFAMSETDAGSDIAAMRTTAVRDGDDWIINGSKTWISNAGIADHYVVFCRLPDGGERPFGAFVVEASSPGLNRSETITVTAPHPLGTLRFEQCRVPADALLGEPGDGLRIALSTLDRFRPTVGAAALGFARRALHEALPWAKRRRVSGKPLVEHQMTLARLADMAVDVDASALLIYRAAWVHDQGRRATPEAAMAKLYATEAAQRVVDSAVQLLGGRGLVADSPLERLYREVRALRIYEGTSEIQKLVIASHLVKQPG
jgi:alkylation response protein AidB-like acyl-CoA dehydrogenase